MDVHETCHIPTDIVSTAICTEKINIPSKWNRSHQQLIRWKVLRAYLHIIGKRGKRKMLSRVPTGIQYACKCQCPIHNHFKIHSSSFTFQKHSLKCVWVHFIPTPLFVSNFNLFKGRYTRTHAHTHTSLHPMYKTGQRLGRDPNHPTRAAGTLVRKPHHLIIW